MSTLLYMLSDCDLQQCRTLYLNGLVRRILWEFCAEENCQCWAYSELVSWDAEKYYSSRHLCASLKDNLKYGDKITCARFSPVLGVM